jgi:hypothetical protein
MGKKTPESNIFNYMFLYTQYIQFKKLARDRFIKGDRRKWSCSNTAEANHDRGPLRGRVYTYQLPCVTFLDYLTPTTFKILLTSQMPFYSRFTF